MPHEVRIPRLGWSMEEGTFVRWLKNDGQYIEVGDALYELEGDKALQEVESIDAGVLRIAPDAPPPGSSVVVGSLLGFLLDEGESLPTTWSAEATPPRPLDPRTDRYEAGARRQSEQVENPQSASRLNIASPRARRVAGELRVDWTALLGTGRGGRVREADVRAAAVQSGDQAEATGSELLAVSPRRRTIAERLRIGQQRLLPVTLTTSADAANLLNLRQQFQTATLARVPGFTDIIIGVLARVLRQHRRLAARWQDDHQSMLVPGDHGYHIGIAVDTADGLLVPVVRDADSASLSQLAAQTQSLIDQARSGQLTAAHMQGGVFTVSNLGALGVDAFTPMIHYPEVAILGVGAIRRQASVGADDRIVAQDRLTLSLTFDHGAIDGAPAAAFLNDLVRALENPGPVLLEGR